MTIAVAVSILPRLIAMAGFRPALMTSDSFLYMREAVNHRLGEIRPSGYSMFLGLFSGLPHVLTVITALQHLMGIAIAVIVYALLRQAGLPGWGATLAALPVLLDPREIALESSILPDTLFCLVVLVAVVLLLRPRPGPWRCGGVALLLAYATILRGNGILLVVAVAAVLLLQRAAGRALLAFAAVFILAVGGYALGFHSEYGTYNLTASDGMFLWSRTTSFANCGVIKPPADLRPLCPAANVPTPVIPASPPFSPANELTVGSPADYLWSANAWWRRGPNAGFDPRNNALAMRFALDAITAQPLSYVRVVATDVLLTFTGTDRPQDQADLSFTPLPRLSPLPGYYQSYLKAYANTTENTHPVYPWASLMFGYQQPVWFPGLLFLLIVVGGLAGVLLDWRRRGGPQLLPWALAAVLIISPAALTESLYRYAIAAIPLACLAAGLSWQRQRAARVSPGAEPAEASGAGSVIVSQAGAPAAEALQTPSTSAGAANI
jgi:hypothetical protein